MTTATYITMTEDEWFEKFQPMINPLEQAKNARNTVIFETFGDDAEYVFKIDPHYVWTDMDGDSGSYIVEGRHYVNRNFYYVTRHPWKDGESYDICTFSDADRDDCLECGRLFHEDNLTNDGEGYCMECHAELDLE